MTRRRLPLPWSRQPQQFVRARGDVGLVHLYGIRTGDNLKILDLCGKAHGSFGAGSPTPTGVYWDYDNNGYHLKLDTTGTGSLDSIMVNLGAAGATSTKNHSVIAKIWLASIGAQQTIYGSGFGGFQFRVNTSNQLNLLCSGTADLGSSTTSLTSGAWYWVGVSYDGSTSRFYLGGKADGTGSGSNTFSTSINYSIGNRGGPSTSEGFSDGSKIGPVATFNRILSDEEFRRYSNDFGFWSLLEPRKLLTPVPSSGGTSAALDGVGVSRNSGTAGLSTAIPLAASGKGINSGTSNLIGSAAALAASGSGSNFGLSAITTAIQLVGFGLSKNSGTSSLAGIASALDGTGTGRNAGIAGLSTAIPLAAAGTGRNSGSADFAGGAAALDGAATGRNSGSAGLSTAIPLAAAGTGHNSGFSSLAAGAANLDASGTSRNSGQSDLITAIRFAAFMAGINSGVSGLDIAGDQLDGVGVSSNRGVCGLTTGIKFTASGTGHNSGTVAFAVDLYGENARYGYIFDGVKFDLILNSPSVGYIMPATNFDIVLAD